MFWSNHYDKLETTETLKSESGKYLLASNHYDKLETTETKVTEESSNFLGSNHYDKLETTEISQWTMDNGQWTINPEGFREQLASPNYSMN